MRELSDFCRIMNFFNSRQFEIPFIFVLFLVCLGLAIYTYILPHLRIKKIYHELRQRTYAEREINVTFIKEEMESEYG